MDKVKALVSAYEQSRALPAKINEAKDKVFGDYVKGLREAVKASKSSSRARVPKVASRHDTKAVTKFEEVIKSCLTASETDAVFKQVEGHNEPARLEQRFHELMDRIKELSADLVKDFDERLHGDSWHVVKRFYESTSFASQGLGKRAYAMGAPKVYAHVFERMGFVTRTSTEDKGVFAFEAKVSRAGLIAIKNAPFDYEPAVRFAWRIGLNPRVIFPFVPHGFEQEHGISMMP